MCLPEGGCIFRSVKQLTILIVRRQFSIAWSAFIALTSSSFPHTHLVAFGRNQSFGEEPSQVNARISYGPLVHEL